MATTLAPRALLIGRSLLVWLAIIGLFLFLLSFGSVRLVSAVTQHGGDWMFFAYEGFGEERDENTVVESTFKTLDVTGNGDIDRPAGKGPQVYNGPMHSNRNMSVSGSRNDFNDDVRYFDDFDDTAADPPDVAANFYADLAQASSTLDWPGTTGPQTGSGDTSFFVAPTCNFTTTGTKAMQAGDPDGVYCGVNFDVSNNNLGTQAAPRKWTFIATGLINVAGQGNWIVPADTGDGVLAYSTAQSTQAIEWHGNLGGARGLIHAPNGHADVEGNENQYCVQVVAQRIEVGGNSNVFNWPCLTTTPTPTPTPTPPQGPTVSIVKVNNQVAAVPPGTNVSFTLTVTVTNGPADDVIVVDTLPLGYNAPTNISPGGSYDPTTRKITWDLGDEVANGPHVVTYQAAVSAGVANGTVLTNVAVVTSPGTNCPPGAVPPAPECDDDSIVTVVVPGVAPTPTPTPTPGEQVLGGTPRATPRVGGLPSTSIVSPVNGWLAPVGLALMVMALGGLAVLNVADQRSRSRIRR
jgi:hypothetical protein